MGFFLYTQKLKCEKCGEKRKVWVYNRYMIRTKNLVLTSTQAQELTFYDAVEAPCTIIISNNSANKHVFVGGANVSTTNYGIMIAHDHEPVTIKLPAFERLYAVSDNLDVACSVLVIEG